MLSDAIASLGAIAYPMTRRTNNGYDTSGRSIPPTLVSDTISGMMQPLSDREIDRLPEGLHQKELRAFWTTSVLPVADSDAGTVGAHLTDPYAVVWEVVRAAEWDLGGYRRYILSRVDQ